MHAHLDADEFAFLYIELFGRVELPLVEAAVAERFSFGASAACCLAELGQIHRFIIAWWSQFAPLSRPSWGIKLRVSGPDSTQWKDRGINSFAFVFEDQ